MDGIAVEVQGSDFAAEGCSNGLGGQDLELFDSGIRMVQVLEIGGCPGENLWWRELLLGGCLWFLGANLWPNLKWGTHTGLRFGR